MKTDEQFAADIAIGNAFEMNLWRQLSRYIHGIEQPVDPAPGRGKGRNASP